MNNPEWYYYDPNDGVRGLKLTDKAPPEAVKSYEEYCAEIEENDDAAKKSFYKI